MKLFKTFLFIIVSLLTFQIVKAQTYSETYIARANDRWHQDHFGYAVAVDGDYAVIGSPFENEDENGSNTLQNSGSVYIYKRSASGVWSQHQKIVPNVRHLASSFGWSVAIDGNYIVVGAFADGTDADDLNNIGSSGSAYIFKLDGSGYWNQVQKLVAPIRKVDDNFGCSVSISIDKVVIGSYGEDEDENELNEVESSGAAYVYEMNLNDVWVIKQKIVSTARVGADRFGYSVGISGDQMIISALRDETDENENNNLVSCGSAYVLKRDQLGSWNHVQKIVQDLRASGDNFGESVAISGNRIIVGSPGEDEDASNSNHQTDAGAAYVFEKNGSVWIEKNKLVHHDRFQGQFFGKAVSISGDLALVGCPHEYSNSNDQVYKQSSGSAYVFSRGISDWSEIQKITASDRDEKDEFGKGVCIKNNRIVVGAALESQDIGTNNRMTYIGSAYLFETTFPVQVYEEDNNIKLYPNPFESIFNIESIERLNNVLIQIVDVTGAIVYEEIIRSGTHFSIEPKLSSGIYFVKMQSNKKVYGLKKVMKF